MSVQEIFPGQEAITQSASGLFRSDAGSMTFVLNQVMNVQSLLHGAA